MAARRFDFAAFGRYAQRERQFEGYMPVDQYPAMAKAGFQQLHVTSMNKLSHIDASNHPRMVDVGAKAVTARTAVAEAVVRFPKDVADVLREGGMRSKKGPVIDTAIVAGTMAAKRTHELIPFCHPLAIERCRIEADFVSETELAIRCEVAITHKTGVEMEALTGASVAALTIYDMCKALSHEIVIEHVRLLEKSGGKRTVKGGKAAPRERTRAQ